MAKKTELIETERANASAEPAAKKPKAAKKVKVVVEHPPKKPAKKTVKSGAKKASGRKPGPKKDRGAKAKKPSGRKPGVKASAKVPVLAKRKPGPKKQKPIARKADLAKRGEEAFLFATRQLEKIEEMERAIANYERMFEAVRQLFSREMHEIEEWVEGLLK